MNSFFKYITWGCVYLIGTGGIYQSVNKYHRSLLTLWDSPSAAALTPQVPNDQFHLPLKYKICSGYTPGESFYHFNCTVSSVYYLGGKRKENFKEKLIKEEAIHLTDPNGPTLELVTKIRSELDKYQNFYWNII